jgi:hypothetical protein
MKHEVAVEVAKAAPPVTVTGLAWLQGIPIDKLLGWATLLYVVLQASYLVWRWIREIRRGRK